MRLYNINVIFTFDNSYCQKISQKDVFGAALFWKSYWSTFTPALATAPPVSLNTWSI